MSIPKASFHQQRNIKENRKPAQQAQNHDVGYDYRYYGSPTIKMKPGVFYDRSQTLSYHWRPGTAEDPQGDEHENLDP